MKADGKTRVCGIIADPVEHSMSPVLQNLYARRTGVNLAYVPFRVKAEDVGDAVRGAYALNILGLNVTVPHKQRVMEHLCEIDGTAAAVGAVNTLVRTPDGYKGYNTDVTGLERAVTEAGFTVRGRECILIGAGGAAKAAAYLMMKEGAVRLYILNRSVDKAEALAEYIEGLREREGSKEACSGEEGPGKKCCGREDAGGGRTGRWAVPLALADHARIPDGKYFAVQTTSVGMNPHSQAAPIEDPAFYRKIGEAVDVIYTPAETRFMSHVKAAGGRAVNGLKMLLYQGVAAYELWNPGVTVGPEVIAEAGGEIERLLFAGKDEPPSVGGKSGPPSAGGKDIILIGFMGAGKTSVGLAYAKKRGIPMVDTDERIEKEAGMSISELFSAFGEARFRRMETEMLEKLLEENREHRGEGGRLISAGGGLPLREENRELLQRIGTVVYLRVSAGTVLERLKGDTTRPLLQGGNVREKVDSLLAERGPLYEKAAHASVTVDGKAPEQIVEEIERLRLRFAKPPSLQDGEP